MATAQIRINSHNIPAQNVVRLTSTAPASSPHRHDGFFDIARQHATDHRLVAAGAELFAEGESSDNLYVVLKGWVVLNRILEDGRRQILDFALPGAVIGYRARPDTAFAFTAEAITEAEVAAIPIPRVSELLYRGSDCAMTLLDAANEALLGAFDNLTDVGRRTAREAVAHFLLRMDRRIRKAERIDDNDPVSFPLTQEHIGDALGLTAVHVCRTLRALRADGLIETGRGHLKIYDKEALAIEAGALVLNLNDARLAS